MADYNFENIGAAYRASGISKGCVVLLKTDLRLLGLFDLSSYDNILKAHFDALSSIIDLSVGTLVVSTASTGLCNTTNPFDTINTPSERGVLSEFIRKIPGSVRSFHPFHSYTAIGKDAEFITSNVSRHAFGIETPEDRLISVDAICLSVGLHARLTCSTVHHVEMQMGVPYRYNKEYLHPVINDNKTRNEFFYMNVYNRKCEINRNRNVKIFQEFSDNGYKLKKVSLGRGSIYSYSMRNFYMSTVQALKKDIYIWLDQPPITKPYLD
ncbi:hypothetical protein HOL24_09350 [bacterium]|nr:hypothetical protein [bacterium]